MVFSSISFLFFFLPLFLIVYYLVPFSHRKVKWKNIILLIFSLIFYAWGEPVYILLLLFSGMINYANGKMMNKYWHEPKIKTLFLVLSLLVNLGLLVSFTYADFLVLNLNLFNMHLGPLHLGIPMGISFFTLQTMSYNIDVYRGKVHYERSFLDFMIYVCMFPKILAGPIVRYETISEELNQRRISYTNFHHGLMRFMQGLFKKVFIANHAGELWHMVQLLPASELTFIITWIGIIAFALQIYFAFSGYSDMAIGLGKMLGFTFPENFNYPYIATSITDFSQRWHISLSSWFKDYVYIPLGGSKRKIRNIFIVLFLIGIWHGNSLNFVIWGIYFGILLIVEKFVLKKWLDGQKKLVKHSYTIFLILIGWTIFACSSMTYPKEYLLTMIGFGAKSFINKKTMFYLNNYCSWIIIGIIFSMPIYPYLHRQLNRLKNKKLVFGITAFIYLGLFLLAVAYMVSETYHPFLYF